METIKNYIENIPEKWKESYIKLMETVDKNIPKGFEKIIQYNMPTYAIPLENYPKGYLDTKLPLPFISIGVQKNHIAYYHLGIYSDEKLLNWFQEEYKNNVKTKLNMGKSCIRFTNPKNIPYELMGELSKKITAEDWIKIYEESRKR